MILNQRFEKQAPYLFLFGFLSFFLLRMLIIFIRVPDLAGVEQNVIYGIQVFLDNGELYKSPANAPFSIIQYTPLFYYLCGYTAKLFGFTNSHDLQLLYVIGRSWSIVFNVVSALFLYKIARNVLSISKTGAYFIVLSSFAILFSINFAARPDSLCDAIGIASIYAFLRYLQKPKSTNSWLLLLLVVVLSALAVFAKQSGIQLIIIFLGFCILTWNIGDFLKMFLFSLFVYGFFVFLFMYRYPYFFENVIMGLANGINFDGYFSSYVLFNKVFFTTGWLLIVYATYFIFKKKSLFKGSPEIRLLAISLLGSFIFATVTAFKNGSRAQYYILFEYLSLLYIVKMLEDMKGQKLQSPQNKIKSFVSYFYPLYAIAIILMIAYNYGIYYTRAHDSFWAKRIEDANKTIDFIKNDRSSDTTKYYIFPNLGGAYPYYHIPDREQINNVFFKNSLVPQMDILDGSPHSKVFGYNQLDSMIRNEYVQYIIESEPRFQFVLLNSLDSLEKTKYSLIKNIDGYLIFKLNKSN